MLYDDNVMSIYEMLLILRDDEVMSIQKVSND